MSTFFRITLVSATLTLVVAACGDDGDSDLFMGSGGADSGGSAGDSGAAGDSSSGTDSGGSSAGGTASAGESSGGESSGGSDAGSGGQNTGGSVTGGGADSGGSGPSNGGSTAAGTAGVPGGGTAGAPEGGAAGAPEGGAPEAGAAGAPEAGAAGAPAMACDVNQDCADDNPCTDNACVDGLCASINNNDVCDDGDLETRDDVCGDGVCAGDPYDCTPSECEETSVHNGVDCTVTFADPGETCGDGGTCDGDGNCSSNAIPPGGGTVFGSTEFGDPSNYTICDETTVGPDVVFTWTPTDPGTYEISTCNPGTDEFFDTVLAVRTDDSSGDDRECNDDAEGLGEVVCSLVTVSVSQGDIQTGTTYYIIVDGFQAGSVGDFELTVTPVT